MQKFEKNACSQGNLHIMCVWKLPEPSPVGKKAWETRAGERSFKITPTGTDAKAKDNEELIQKAGTVKKKVVCG